MHFIILAAGKGSRLSPLTDTRPKCLVEVAGKSILEWQIETARRAGLRNIAIVRGYRKEAIRPEGVTFFENADYETTNMVETLWCAESAFEDGFIVSYGDILYEQRVLERLLASRNAIDVVVDRGWRGYWEQRFENVLSDAETLQVDRAGRISSIGQKPRSLEEIQGQYIGLIAFRGEGVANLRAVYRKAQDQAAKGLHPFRGQRPMKKMYMTDILQALVDEGYPVHPVPVDRGFLELDTLRDVEIARQLACAGPSGLLIR